MTTKKRRPAQRSNMAMAREYMNKALKHLEAERENWAHELAWIEALIDTQEAVDWISELQSIVKWEKEMELEGVSLVAA